MSTSLTRDQLKSLALLARTPEGQLFLQIVKSWQADVDRRLRRVSGEDLLRAQGDAQRLEEIAGYLEGGAEERLVDLSKPRRPVVFAPQAGTTRAVGS